MSFSLKKLLGKTASVGAAMAIAVGLVPASAGLGSIVASADTFTVYSWSDLKSKLSSGTNTVILGSNITASSSDYAIEISKRANITLDLNGCTINRNMGSASSFGQIFVNLGNFTIKDSKGGGKITGAWHKTIGAIKNEKSGTLTLAGGTITGNTAGSGGNAAGGAINNDGKFYMTGGTITGNKAVRGGGIFNDANAGGEVYISGGTISDNQALTGGGIYNQSKLYISGGTITGNIATGDAYGHMIAGVDSPKNDNNDPYYTANYTYISGNPVITGNHAQGIDTNLSATAVTINGALKTGAKIGFYGTTAGTFTTGWSSYMGTASPSAYFSSDNSNFSVTGSGGEAALTAGGGGQTVTEYYTVKFDANGGSGTMKDMIASSDSLFTLPVCSFKAPSGKTFDSWDLGAENKSVKITKDTTVKAIWKSTQTTTYYTVSYAANGGTGQLPLADTVAAGSSYTISDCKLTPPSGKTFAGWKSGSTTYKANDKVTVNSNMTLTAQWADAVTYCTVSFASNGGSGTMQSVSVAKGSSYTLPSCGFTAPTGYEFNGWDKGTAGVTKITITGNVTLTAQWKAKTYTVTFASNGGSGTMNSVPVTYGSKYTLPACTFKAPAGKVFSKWDKGAANTTSITITGNVTLTAQWTDASAVLKGDVNGDGEIGMKDITDLQRYVNGWDVTIVIANADLNGDGEIGMKDITDLQKLVNSK